MKKYATQLTLLGLLAAAGVQAAPTTVQGTLTNVIIQPTATGSAQASAYIVLKPTVSNCWLGLMNVPNADASYGRAVIAAALSAQAGGKTVSVTYDPAAPACAVSQFVVLTP
ncbi:hypothetical protein [Aquipseudomonas alcaligenes]|uniref:hypothetical protein n=1 Tax=Aquipseudomonas alcaligenes TaxID=43263 RepID=UPI001F1832DF|nr:hypothetical protein [Pseudomonas alcaligenes]